MMASAKIRLGIASIRLVSPVTKIVPPAAEIAGRNAERQANQRVDDLRADTDGKRDAGAVEDAAENVTPLRVGAEPELCVRRQLRIHQVRVEHGIGRRQPGRKQRR